MVPIRYPDEDYFNDNIAIWNSNIREVVKAEVALPPVWDANIREVLEAPTVDEKRHVLGLVIKEVIVKPNCADRVEVVFR